MDSPQYHHKLVVEMCQIYSFKPYYKWIVLNTDIDVLYAYSERDSFKPYYKWIVLNTLDLKKNIDFMTF